MVGLLRRVASDGGRKISRLGPAFVAAIAYVDPGNVAANLTAGAWYGYTLVWVLIIANTISVLVQYLSAKLGVVTGRSLPELLGDRMRRGPRYAFWLQAELITAATDLAEVVGGALALHILFGIPLPLGGLIIGIASLGLLALQSSRGEKVFEAVIVFFLVVITFGFVSGLVVSHVDWGQALAGVVPRLQGSQSMLVATSMLGATVMPHAIYLHSALTRDPAGLNSGIPLPKLLLGTRIDVVASLFVAGSVNIAMLLLAAASLRGVSDTDTIQGAHAAITTALGPTIGLIFGIGLLASGFASTSVGCFAGDEIMKGLLHVRIPLLVRRGVTLVPALVLLWLGSNPTWMLVLSQVLLSLGLPFAIIPLITLTSDRRVMGDYANRGMTRILAWVAAMVVVVINIGLLVMMVK